MNRKTVKSTYYRVNIKELPYDDRPREKLAATGPASLSKAELLAILIGSGNTEETAVELMQRVLKDCGESLRELGRMSIADLTASRYKGMGPAKAISILAACELGKRRAMEAAEEKRIVGSAIDVFRIMNPIMQDLPHEESYALYLRPDHSLIGQPYLISRGGIADTQVDIRLTLREALIRRATSLAFIHNHPSGNLKPSNADDRLTERLSRAARLMDLNMMDHVIITTTSYYSYREQGKL